MSTIFAMRGSCASTLRTLSSGVLLIGHGGHPGASVDGMPPPRFTQAVAMDPAGAPSAQTAR
jgi:hypothetical protein